MMFRKLDPKKVYDKVGLFHTIELSEVGKQFGVELPKIVTYWKGSVISSEEFTEERWEQKTKESPGIILETRVKDIEEIPYNKVLLGRLELPRLGVVEE
jgi:hypothetical protein